MVRISGARLLSWFPWFASKAKGEQKMQIPLQISFRNMETSSAVEARIREEVDKLSDFYSRITSCRVVAEIPHRHRESGERFHISVYLTVPGAKITASNEPSLHGLMQDVDIEKRGKQHEAAGAHKDIYVAVRDAFKAARRQLQDFVHEQRGDVKYHEAKR
jgi:ribosome-associated translation inhibitor RaiA